MNKHILAILAILSIAPVSIGLAITLIPPNYLSTSGLIINRYIHNNIVVMFVLVLILDKWRKWFNKSTEITL